MGSEREHLIRGEQSLVARAPAAEPADARAAANRASDLGAAPPPLPPPPDIPLRPPTSWLRRRR